MSAALIPATQSRARLLGRESFTSLRRDWTRLADTMPSATPFSTWEWAAAWLDTIGREVEVRLAVIDGHDGVSAILPLAAGLQPGPFPGMRCLTSCSVDAVYPDQLEPLVNESQLPMLLDSALDLVWTDAQRWDSVRLPMIAEDSVTAAELGRRAKSSAIGRRIEWREVSTAPFLAISGDYESYLKTLSSNERYKIRSRSRKLLSGRSVEYSDAGSLDAVQALRVLRELHAKRARQKGIVSTFDTEQVQRFHERLLDVLPKERVVWRCLRSGSNIFAMFYGFRFANRLFYFQLGYDPEWSEFSAGLVLLSQTIREAFETGCREYNFLQGNEPFKSTWTRSSRRLCDWTFYAPDARGELFYRMSRMRTAARSCAGRLAAAGRSAVGMWRRRSNGAEPRV